MEPIGRQAVLAEIDRAMVCIRRSQTKRAIGRLMERQAGLTFDPSHSFVVDALHEPSASDEPPSVGMVAERLGIDPSRASRMVASAVEAGYVRRVAAQRDGRRTGLELTARGRKLLKRDQQFRRQFFADLLAGWSDSDCATFAALLARFTAPL